MADGKRTKVLVSNSETDKPGRLRSLLSGRPHTLAVVEAVLGVWPEHASYLLKNFSLRSEAMLEATEAAAEASRKIIDGQEALFAADYRWTCDRLRDEEIFFHREGRYRLSTFENAMAEVYSDHEYMGHYVNGLLLSQLLWFNHAATFEMFLNRVLGAIKHPFDYLEIGPGHGLMIFFAAMNPMCQTLEAWDVSTVSLRETNAALQKMGAAKSVTLFETDILAAQPPSRLFDQIVISEVLEHLEQPRTALRFLRRAIADGGKLFVNVPLNSPSPDHIYLLSSPKEATDLVEEAGWKVKELELFATQGRPIENALANRISVSAGIIAEPA